MAIASDRGNQIFRKMERDLRRLSSDHRPETVHSFRTTTRRLQTLLEELLPGGGRNQKKLLERLNRIRKRAGKVRDIDAQLGALRSLKVPQEPRRKTQLTHGLIELRVKHEKRLNKLLTGKHVEELRKRLRKVLKDADFAGGGDALASARQSLITITPTKGVIDEETLHRSRIVVKRARYAVEFAPASAESAQFMAQLKKLQDTLGHWHDWLTLTQSAVDRFGDVGHSSLVAALHNVTRGKFRLAVSALSNQAAWTPQKPASGSHQRRKTDPARADQRTEAAA
jgi:CHAD domain-containing protein